MTESECAIREEWRAITRAHYSQSRKYWMVRSCKYTRSA